MFMCGVQFKGENEGRVVEERAGAASLPGLRAAALTSSCCFCTLITRRLVFYRKTQSPQKHSECTLRGSGREMTNLLLKECILIVFNLYLLCNVNQNKSMEEDV